MSQTQFTISKAEVRDIASVILTDDQVNKILCMVENDQVLWNQIRESLINAIQFETVARD